MILGSKGKFLTHTVVVATLNGGCGMFTSEKSGKKLEENDRKLAGEWEGACVQQDWFGFAYQQQTLRFSSIGDFDRTTALYSDQQCHEAVGILVERGTYAALGESKTAEGAHDINLTISAATVRPQSSESADQFNEKKYCGINDWQRDQAKDVLGRECSGVSHPNGEVVYDIYRLENEGSRLLTGKGSIFESGNDAASRPTRLNDKQTFKRK
jgi:hypothetical protein